MQLVRQNEECGGKGKHAESRDTAPADPRPRPHRPTLPVKAVAAVIAVAALAAGCASGETEKKAVPPAPGQQAAAKAEKKAAAHTALVAASKRWGIAKPPLQAPEPPAKKPALTTRKGFEVDDQKNFPPVYTTVPTKDKVVFLTIDDGAAKDPRFIKMMSDLKIPYTAFLSDYVVNDDYAYFKKMQSHGVGLNNHTLNHRYLPGLSYEQQEREICGMQDIIEKQYGTRPTLFRPPFGNYNQDTLRAAKSCGIKSVPLWNAEAFDKRMDWREEDRDLHPGDIILTHFRGKDEWKGGMPSMIRNVLKTVTDKGYAIARLEDYV
ncbi:Peptidoglycan-N-acetylmuramic acid deacetylase PdaC [Streptomyces sp. YIM 130001]|uniref:polysaccharide deacetylase family protein n=1 Tax=Streptomyces sp. YIM 130001 TaxID=2259644 RepID=UPI000EBBE9F7|nr:polysaccharide deacetylase family protein [Streptomyces sp. YIM 130001]RII21009.1 Peptidoglycan-N-acetylmuramic acid deacetylase PdaC [Streptomyces sp. YIM 130001]